MDWIEIKYEINSKKKMLLNICAFDKKHASHNNAKCARHWSIIQDSKPSSNWRIIFWD
jgi:hypothetical protein